MPACRSHGDSPMKSVLYVVCAESSLIRCVSYILYSLAGSRMYIGGIFLADEEIQLSLGLPPDVITLCVCSIR